MLTGSGNDSLADRMRRLSWLVCYATVPRMLHGKYVKMCLKRWMLDAVLEMSMHTVYVC